MAEALTGLTIDCPFGVKGTVTMRDDHTLIDYAVGWGKTTPAAPYIVDIQPGDWAEISALEKAWKTQMKYT